MANTIMKRKLTSSVWQEGEWFVAQCLEVDVASQGETAEIALLKQSRLSVMPLKKAEFDAILRLSKK